jgi:prolyl oligopeptidase
MHKSILIIFVIALFAMNGCRQKITVKYTATKKIDTVTDYFGTKVPDPYRWLENDTATDVAEWVEAENKITSDYLSKIPFRDSLNAELTRIWNYPKYRVPFREGPWYFFYKNDGLQNQYVLYTRNGIDGNPKVLIDPNKLSEDGTIALAGISPSHGGKYLAYTIARSGSDWNEIIILEIESGKQLPDTLKWVKFSDMAWQGGGFYYSRYDAPVPGMELTSRNEFQKIFFHKLGTTEKEDQLIYENKNEPKRSYSATVTNDERFLFIYESETTDGVALYYKDLSKRNMPFRQLAEGFEYQYEVVDNIGDKFLIVTNYKAPKKKLILMDPSNPEPDQWKTIIPERDDVLESVDIAGQYIVSQYMQNAVNKAFVYDMSGKFLHEIDLPGLGTINNFRSKKGDNIAFYGFTGFRYPTTIFKYDVAANKSIVYNAPEIDFTPEDYEVKQVFYSSKDKTTIPMFLVYKKGIELNGLNPTMLYGYGGFNVSVTPGFSIARLLFLKNGGIYAVPNIRGGGEFGEDWHKAGTKERKQNVFDDFIAAAEFLIAEKYTSPEKLGIIGGSNGGLLVGAVMTQRPELFKVAIPQVGVMDMLRYHLFTIGRTWSGDFGTSDTKEGFDYLYKYSPLQNIKKGIKYPATLAFTADHDDRVVPAHTFKFIATLQEYQEGDNPVLVRIDTKAGHGGGKPTAKLINEAADLWSFVFWNLGMELK